MKWKNVVIAGYNTDYRISEYGDVYSLKKKRLLKGGTIGNAPYLYKAVNIEYAPNKRKWFSVHRLVHTMFISPIPEGHEINHKDMNKFNNHFSNLEVVTHSENMIHARQNNNWHGGRGRGFTHNEETRQKMREAKYRQVNVYEYDKLLFVCGSIEETAERTQSYRKKVYRALKTGKPTRFQDHTYVMKYANQ